MLDEILKSEACLLLENAKMSNILNWFHTLRGVERGDVEYVKTVSYFHETYNGSFSFLFGQPV